MLLLLPFAMTNQNIRSCLISIQLKLDIRGTETDTDSVELKQYPYK
jgi:hypothetical protein